MICILQFIKNSNVFQEQMLAGNKNLLLSILVFLLSDVETFKKRCYLYQFLHLSEIPPDLEQDEGNLK